MKNNDIKKYYFSEEIAIEVGVEEAIMLYNIYHWIKHNKIKENSTYNFHNGNYWMFNTIKTFTLQYPFWTESMIKRILKNLKNANYITTNMFNKFGYDKTTWYTVTKKGLDILERPNETAEIE
jgi:hypothetical protein